VDKKEENIHLTHQNYGLRRVQNLKVPGVAVTFTNRLSVANRIQQLVTSNIQALYLYFY